jgi:protease-4
MIGEFSGKQRRLLLVVAIASIIIVSGFFYLFFDNTNKTSIDSEALIGVIKINGAIISSEDTDLITESISEAISNLSIKGVVIKIDSPGGFAHLVEQIYLDLIELKKYKPTVSSVVTALSGGYYIAVATDTIYTQPSSMVGNIGVLGVAPDDHIPSESNIETGPYKVTGFSRLLFPFNVTGALESFVNAVEKGRGENLKISSNELSKGLIYIGKEAINVGLIDEIGSLQKAIEHVAIDAGITEYEIVDITVSSENDGLATLSQNRTELPWRELSIATLNVINPPPALYYLYLPTKAFSLESFSNISFDGTTNVTDKITKGQLIIDLSHGNRVSQEAFHLLSAELAMRGVTTAYGGIWSDVESILSSASCLIIVAPTEPYNEEEANAIKEFVNKGRILLMFYDPSTESNNVHNSLRPINSLANQFGITFARGYIYNLEDNYGLYRNIYIRSFENTSLTNGLDTLIFFTSTYIHATDSDAAYASLGTFSSVTENQGVYSPISVIEKGNGTKAAFGDLTFLVEPYVYLEDNLELLMNIVRVISEIDVPIQEPEPEPGRNITKPVIPIGTVKHFTETIDGEEHELVWTKITENKTMVERPDRITTYYTNEEGDLVSWESDGTTQTFEEPLPDIPFPLTEGLGWSYKVGYNLTLNGNNWQGVLESRGHVVGFEYVKTAGESEYWCAKISALDVDKIQRTDDKLTVESTEMYWISQEAGLVKSQGKISYYIDDAFFLEEDRRLLLSSIKKGEN